MDGGEFRVNISDLRNDLVTIKDIIKGDKERSKAMKFWFRRVYEILETEHVGEHMAGKILMI